MHALQLLKDMKQLYDARCGLEEEEMSAATATLPWKHLHNFLFQKVRVRVHGDYWLRENAGASQPGEDPEDAYDEEAPDWTADAPEEATKLMVVSSEYVAKQVM